MELLSIKVRKNKVEIDKGIFLSLLAASPIKAYATYKEAVGTSQISFSDLKELALKANVPYPLFFAPIEVVKKQIIDKEKNLFEKLPTKNEMRLVSRGGFKIEDVELIVRDLGRKQEFLNKRILTNSRPNPFVGYVAKKIKRACSDKELADDIRSYLGIDLQQLRGKTKAQVLNYIRDCAEAKGILVSFSSYNFMPQNLDRELRLSGLCVKDKRFPIVFINTRDGDEKPKIIESDGRQIFTLLAMLTCVAMNRFVFSTSASRRADPLLNKVNSVVAEIIIPKEDLLGVLVANIDELKTQSTVFKVTPSMLLERLRECRRIEFKLYLKLKAELQDEADSIPPIKKRTPLQTTGYGKYNGKRFSKEVIRAYGERKINRDEVKNIFFRKGKMDTNLFQEYENKFR